MTIYKYKSVEFKRHLNEGGVVTDAMADFDTVANGLGADGWRIVSVLPTALGFNCFFELAVSPFEICFESPPQPVPEVAPLKVKINEPEQQSTTFAPFVAGKDVILL